MCGFVGFANFEKNISQEKDLLQKMNNSISRRGPDEQGYYIDKNVAMAHKRLIVIDPETTNGRKIFFWNIHYCL